MSVFKVLREKPSEGIVFDYITEAGPDAAGPDAVAAPGQAGGVARDQVVSTSTPSRLSPGGDLPTGWVEATHQAEFGLYKKFTYEDRKGNHWVYRGLHDGPPTLVAGTYDASGFDTQATPATATAKVGEAFSYTVHTSRRPATLLLSASSSTPLPAWLSINGMTLSGTAQGSDADADINLVITPLDGSAAVVKTLKITVSSDASVAAAGQAAMSLSYDDGGVTQELGNRPPDLAAVPTAANSFNMRFYYKTLPGFAWPSATTPPGEGSIVPYLRPVQAARRMPVPVNTPSLDIVYRPVWPADTPVLNLSETLTNAKKGLPAVRGQSSLKVLVPAVDRESGRQRGGGCQRNPARSDPGEELCSWR